MGYEEDGSKRIARRRKRKRRQRMLGILILLIFVGLIGGGVYLVVFENGGETLELVKNNVTTGF